MRNGYIQPDTIPQKPDKRRIIPIGGGTIHNNEIVFITWKLSKMFTLDAQLVRLEHFCDLLFFRSKGTRISTF